MPSAIQWIEISRERGFGESPDLSGAIAYGIRFRGGHWSYFQPALGSYVDHWSMPLQFVLLAAVFAVAWRHHRGDQQP